MEESCCDPLEPLSRREIEVFYLLCDGLKNKAIGQKLFISPRTVETHRSRIMRKLGFKNFAELLRFGIRNSLVAL